MFSPKMMIAALLVAASQGCAGAAAQSDDLSWVEKRVEEWRVKPSERKFDLIGWAPDVRTGLALAKQHNRPLFVYSHNGRMARGRC